MDFSIKDSFCGNNLENGGIFFRTIGEFERISGKNNWKI